MLNKEYNIIKDFISQHRNLFELITPQSKENVQEAEKNLDVHFPNSYKDFLLDFGSLSFGGLDIYGLVRNGKPHEYIHEDIICNTLEQRRLNKEPTFPHEFIPIYELGNGEITCLDTSQMNKDGECPVVAWYFGATEKLADSFGEFLLEQVQSELKRQENKD